VQLFQALGLEIRSEAGRWVAVPQPGAFGDVDGNHSRKSIFGFDRLAVSLQKMQVGADCLRCGLQRTFGGGSLGNTTQQTEHMHHGFAAARARLEV